MVRRTILELVPATGTNDEDLLFLRQGGEDKRLTVETLRDDLQPDIPDGTETQRGLVRLASESEAQTGIGNDSAVTPAGLESKTATTIRRGIVELATNAETVTGTSSTLAVTPAGLGSRTATVSRSGLVSLASNTDTIAGTSSTLAVTPAGLESKTATTTRRGLVELATNAETDSGIDSTKAVTPNGVRSVLSTLRSSNAIGSYRIATISIDTDGSFSASRGSTVAASRIDNITSGSWRWVDDISGLRNSSPEGTTFVVLWIRLA